MIHHWDDLQQHEAALERIYMDLTGASEAQARNVLMFVCAEEEEVEPLGAEESGYSQNRDAFSAPLKKQTGSSKHCVDADEDVNFGSVALSPEAI